MDKIIQVTRSSMPPFEEFVEEIKELWDSHWLTNMGIKHMALQRQLADYLGVGEISLYTNGHLALEIAIDAFGLSGEVITTPFTFASTTNAIVRRGLKPVFCDINDSDYTIDVSQIESLITSKTMAIMPVHVYGNVCDVRTIEKIAKKHKLKVIYDAAHSFGVKVEDRGIGSYGDASMFSFHATKVYNTIEGGAIAFNDLALRRILEEYRNFGISSTETVRYVGGNAKMNEFQAAMGLCNLRHVNEEISKRKKITERYKKNLKGTQGIITPKSQPGVTSNYSYFPVIFDGYKMSRDDVFERLMKNNIFSRKYFYPLTSTFECFKGAYTEFKLPVATWVASHVLTLPLYADLSGEDVDRICELIINT